MRSIGEVAESLDLPQHVLRFWETRFKEIDPLKRAGGRRLYRQRDVEIVVAIRHLLYGEGYTIKGVQRILKEQGVDAVIAEVLRRMDGKTEVGEAAPDLFAAGADVPASDGDVDEAEAEAMEPEPSESQVDDPQPPAAALPDNSEAPAAPAPAPLPRPLNEDDAQLLRAALAEIEECRRLLRLTMR